MSYNKSVQRKYVYGQTKIFQPRGNVGFMVSSSRQPNGVFFRHRPEAEKELTHQIRSRAINSDILDVARADWIKHLEEVVGLNVKVADLGKRIKEWKLFPKQDGRSSFEIYSPAEEAARKYAADQGGVLLIEYRPVAVNQPVYQVYYVQEVYKPERHGSTGNFIVVTDAVK